VPVGSVGTTPAAIDRFAAMGFDFLVAGVDVGHLVAGQADAVAAADAALQ
jgi:2-keto-3-deoxy-L-rhamnonate aldolase RhmA